MPTRVHQEIAIEIHGEIIRQKTMKGRDSAIPEVEVKEAAVVASEVSVAPEEVMVSVEVVAAFTKRLVQLKNFKTLKTSKMAKLTHTEEAEEVEVQEVLEDQEVAQEVAEAALVNTENLEVEADVHSLVVRITTNKKSSINLLKKVIMKIALSL